MPRPASADPGGRRRRGAARAALLIPLALLVGVLALKALDPGPLASLRLAVFDGYQRLRPRPYTAAPVRIVAIDDASLAAEGQWPWPRDRLAVLVETLAQAGAATVVFDMVFAEPDRTSPALMADEIAQALPETLHPALAAAVLPDHDRRFAEAIGAVPVVLGFALGRGPSAATLPERWSFAFAGSDPTPRLHGFAGAVTALGALQASASGEGAMNAVPDSDGVVRRLPLLFRLGDRIVPALAAEALRVAQGAGTYVVKSAGASGVESLGADSGVAAVKIGAAEVDTDPASAVWLWSTGPRRERFLSAAAVLAGDFDPTLVAGHIVLIGATAAGLADLRASPLDPAGPGVELHAQLIEQVIAGIALNRPDWAAGANSPSSPSSACD
ncbi:MAG: CHASE2 domain-containing protein [Alphaproteobacteria bacterium]